MVDLLQSVSEEWPEGRDRRLEAVGARQWRLPAGRAADRSAIGADLAVSGSRRRGRRLKTFVHASFRHDRVGGRYADSVSACVAPS